VSGLAWQPILLFAVAGFLVGGVVVAWRNGSRIGAAVLGVIVLACAAGGVLWVLDPGTS
jgi:hypothetical protein